ncbi:MAG TPA: 4-phosphopantetheinyl transferase [Actinobacteria bacterium]|nr:4-phosphopantetheinyl transferase [Actinomycetota bacterium]
MRPVPPGHIVDVWWFDTEAVTITTADLAELDAGETRRAGSFLFPADRHRYQVAHVMLRRVLAGYCGTAPGDLAFSREPCPRCGGASGRPVLAPASAASATAWFSLAHSSDLVAIAVAGHPVGVDVERDPAGCVCSLAGVLHAGDAGALAGLAEPDRHAAVISCWVRAEAVLKCTGEGIAHGLGEFPVGTGGTGSAGGATTTAHGCAVRDLAAPSGYRAAVALAGTSRIEPRACAGPLPAR